mmetsp:Transcript_39111/g.38740  ORF Transcript_39111/g.38740 Transcript_39111/m.38740 type:complete len:89 (-) Transcript_39111:29-295(-)
MILRQNADLSPAKISPVSSCASDLYEWTKLALKYFDIKHEILSLGIKQVEEKIESYKTTSQKMLKVFEKILANQQFWIPPEQTLTDPN